MQPVDIDLVVEGVVDGDGGARCSVDAVHVVLEVGTVAVSVAVALRQEQVRVNHLVLHRQRQAGNDNKSALESLRHNHARKEIGMSE